MTIIDASAIASAASLAAIACAQWFREQPPVIVQPQEPPAVNVKIDVPAFPPIPAIPPTPPLPPWPPYPQPMVVVKVLPVASDYAASGFSPSSVESVQLLKKTEDGGYSHLGHRHLDHPDVAAARTEPSLAIRFPDGHIEES